MYHAIVSFIGHHWMAALGSLSSVLVAQANLPGAIEGWERMGSLGLLGIFMWFTLVRLEAAIKGNTEATNKLVDHLQRKDKE